MIKTRFIILTLSLILSCFCAAAQSTIVKDFKPACDSLSILVQERHRIADPKLKLNAVMKRSGGLDFYFTESLCDCPWYANDPQWFRNQLKKLFPDKYRNYTLGQIYTKKQTLDKLVVPELGFNGKPSKTERVTDNPQRKNFVHQVGAQEFSQGLDGRIIALWQSHGRYYDCANEKWEWQRPCLFQTAEDMFTQSFVLPYLVPMLENSGAYVMLPRERDIQVNEVITDNDETCGARGSGTYEEEGKWSEVESGFADIFEYYKETENPFRLGTARKADCIGHDARKGRAEIRWTPDIPERGEYAVYVSYKTLPNSTESACYEVSHLGGKSSFIVNQKMGGSTWIYLGTFEFEEGAEGYVSLSNVTPEGSRHDSKAVVTADAVRFGGGMGNIARCGEQCEPSVSGMARSAEGARYWLQWAGLSTDLYHQNDGKNDYRDDFMSRGDWVEWITRGSEMNPSAKEGLGIPVDLSLGFHSDAGVTPNDSIVGTLAIYTLRSEGSEKLPGGESRYNSREYADMVQSQIVNDIRAGFEPEWSRRWILDRAYRESRTPSCPAMLLELLSHQNFADMKYGLDPEFRFHVARAIYKGMLKYLSNRYGCNYSVQPLPVTHAGVSFAGDGKARISWKAAHDDIEPTASAKGFILETRKDDGAFDTGAVLTNVRRDGDTYSTTVSITSGHIYSFRIRAYNDGGKSFPSETVSIGIPVSGSIDRKVLIINNFDRISGPAFIDTQEYAGFNNRIDSGVPDRRDIAYVGDMYEFRRDKEFISNDNPGFGGSYTDRAGEIVAGNTHDYIIVHGRAVMNAGYPFYSCSNETFCSDSTFRKEAWSADIICGKQVTTVKGSGKMPQKYTVFTEDLQKAITKFTADGGNILVSGAYIASDIWDQIYPVKTDSTFLAESRKFAQNILGYKWGANFGSRKGEARPSANKVIKLKSGNYAFHNEMNQECYCIENPDGIVPASKKGAIIMRYADTNVPAAISNDSNGYRTVCFGFPLETLRNEEQLESIINSTLEYFNR